MSSEKFNEIQVILTNHVNEKVLVTNQVIIFVTYGVSFSDTQRIKSTLRIFSIFLWVWKPIAKVIFNKEG